MSGESGSPTAQAGPASSQAAGGAPALERQRTVRFTEHAAAGVPLAKQSQLHRSRAAGASMAAPQGHVATVLRSQAAPDVNASPAKPSVARQHSGDLTRGPADAVKGPGMHPHAAGGNPAAAAAARSKSTAALSTPRPEAADHQQQQQQQRGRRVFEIEGTPSSLLRIADTQKMEPYPPMKIANVTFIPPARSRSGSCPIFSRCRSRQGSQQFSLVGNIPGYQRQLQQQQQTRARRKQQVAPLFSSMCCFLPSSNNRNSHYGSAPMTGDAYRELLHLREQNAALLKEKEELLRRELAALKRAMEEEASAAAASRKEVPIEHIEQLQALEEENTELRRQLADLGTALCTAGAAKNGLTANAVLASQLRTAHADVTKLKTIVRSQLRAAGFAQDGIGQAMKTVGKGGEVFATDPNDITVQQAALDSLLARGKRRVLAAREFVWSAVATLKDLVDQTFERMGRLVKSDASVRQKIAYVHELHGLVTSQLDPALKAYNDLDGIHSELENLKGVVFDPKRNNPYCPCRPRRMVLEDDLEHVQRQLRETNEALRTVRTQLIKLEMESLAIYVQEKTAQPTGPSLEAAGNPHAGMPRDQQRSALVPAATPSIAATPAAAADGGLKEADCEEEESMEALLRRAQKEHDAAKVEEAIKALKDEVEMLKDRAMLEDVQKAQPPGYLAEELFSQGLVVAKLATQLALVARLPDVCESCNFSAAGEQGCCRTCTPASAGRLAAFARDGEIMTNDMLDTCELRQIQKPKKVAVCPPAWSQDINTGAVPLERVVQRAANVLGGLRLEELPEGLDPEDLHLLKMIDEQSAKVHRINMELQQVVLPS
ncbi:hypothetical protein Efla_005241 [Eimeria flavescens]